MSVAEVSFERIHQALTELTWFEARRVERLDVIARSTDRISPLPIDMHGLRLRYDALVAARDHFQRLAKFDSDVRGLLATFSGRPH